MQVMIRNMTTDDLEQVTVIERQAFSVPWSRQGFADALKQDAVFLVAELPVRQGIPDTLRIAGYIGMYRAFDEGEITNVAVRGDLRRNGIARKLVQEIRCEAAKRGVRRLVLEVRGSNAAAIRLYEGCGFRKLGERRDFYEKPREDADIMVCEEW